MCHRSEADVYSSVLAEFLELFRGEVTAVVGDDAVGNPESAGDHLEEIDNCGGALICDRHCFDPLGEFIDGDKQMSVPSRRRGW